MLLDKRIQGKLLIIWKYLMALYVILQAIVGGCACFWGSVFSMGITYMMSFEPKEIVKEEEWYNNNKLKITV